MKLRQNDNWYHRGYFPRNWPKQKNTRRNNRRAWIIWGVEVISCLAIGTLLGWMYGRAW
jgi:hypothetical protein